MAQRLIAAALLVLACSCSSAKPVAVSASCKAAFDGYEQLIKQAEATSSIPRGEDAFIERTMTACPTAAEWQAGAAQRRGPGGMFAPVNGTPVDVHELLLAYCRIMSGPPCKGQS